MPNRIDTSSIPRIGVYTKVIESANLVPDTSQDILDKAVSSMRLDIDDINSQWLNLILTVGLMNGCIISAAVFTGSALFVFISIIMTWLTLSLNKFREERVMLDLTAKVLTEEKSNVPPIAPSNSGLR